VGFVAEHNAAGTGHFQPPFEPHRLRLKDVRAAEQIPQCRLTLMNEKVANASVYSVNRVRIIALDQGGIPVVAAVLN
jgi:hypothetical protein